MKSKVSVADSIIAEAQSDLHMSEYPSRKQSLDVSRSSWIAMVDNLLVLYRKLYVECSTGADRSLAFQIRWVAGVTSLLSNPILSLLSLELQDACSVLHSLAAAVWKHCCNVICSYQRERACVAAASVVPVQIKEKHYWRFFGWAVCSSVDVLKRKREQQSGKLSASDCKELDLSHSIRLQDKEENSAVGDIPFSLQLLDEGRLTYLRPEHLPFARNALTKIYGVANHDGFSTYGENFVHVTSPCIKFDKTLHLPLVESVSATNPDQFNEVIIKKVAHRLVVKVLNAVLGEVVETAEQLMLLSSGSSTTSDLNLCDKLHPANA